MPSRPASHRVQIVLARIREDMSLNAGDVIEAPEGVVAPVDPA